MNRKFEGDSPFRSVPVYSAIEFEIPNAPRLPIGRSLPSCQTNQNAGDKITSGTNQVTNHRLEGGGSGNGLKALFRQKAGKVSPHQAGFKEVDGLNHLL